MDLKPIVSSLGLKNVPLALCGVGVGVMLAAADYHVDFRAVFFLLLTAAAMCMLSAVCGQQRESKVMKRIMTGTVLLSGLLAIRFSFGTIFSIESFVIMLTGVFVVRYAMKYGSGFSGGIADELLLMLFSGIIGVCGSYFIVTHSFGTKYLLLPALSVGLFTAAVHDLRNIRDMESDSDCRMTFAAKLGGKGARVYYTLMLLLACLSMTAYAFFRIYDPWHFMFVAVVPFFIWNAVAVWMNSGASIDRCLVGLMVLVPVACALFGMGFIMYLLA